MAEMAPKHFLDLDRVGGAALRQILDLGAAYKRGATTTRLDGRMLAMIFERPSTRTRLSFEVAMKQLGGGCVVLSSTESQLSRGETLADTARVLSRYVDAVMFRARSAADLEELAAASSVPVINGLTNLSHPCQVMADVMTLEERKGPLDKCVVTWCGDGNNVATSWIHAAARFGFELRLACPKSLRPPASVLAWAKAERGRVSVTDDPRAAADGADCLVTDTWVSMGAEGQDRVPLLTPYRVDEALMARAKPGAIFMHCLPAKRGQEVSAGVIDGEQSAVWDEAENRLHVQKAILVWCLA
jgi:ornithine carbamoyltransferase